MSWSLAVAGKAPAVVEKAKAELAFIKCMEPEETIKNTVAGIIETACLEGAGAYVIKASGSQYRPEVDGPTVNAVSLSIEPLFGFVE